MLIKKKVSVTRLIQGVSQKIGDLMFLINEILTEIVNYKYEIIGFFSLIGIVLLLGYSRKGYGLNLRSKLEPLAKLVGAEIVQYHWFMGNIKFSGKYKGREFNFSSDYRRSLRIKNIFSIRRFKFSLKPKHVPKDPIFKSGLFARKISKNTFLLCRGEIIYEIGDIVGDYSYLNPGKFQEILDELTEAAELTEKECIFSG
ncbi:hypothetical protein BVX98_05885 [bacterium F11]|nr:hypothetical protein BVX98_05885 [bacterium F11]